MSEWTATILVAGIGAIAGIVTTAIKLIPRRTVKDEDGERLTKLEVHREHDRRDLDELTEVVRDWIKKDS